MNGVHRFSVGLLLLALGLISCEGDGEEKQFCAYTVGLYQQCDITCEGQAPKTSTCIQYLSACNAVNPSNVGCNQLSECLPVEGSKNICTKRCSGDSLCPNGGHCDGDYCVP